MQAPLSSTSSKHFLSLPKFAANKKMRFTYPRIKVIDNLLRTGFPYDENWIREFYDQFYPHYQDASKSTNELVCFESKDNDYSIECFPGGHVWIVFNEKKYPETILGRGMTKIVVKIWDLTSGKMAAYHMQTDASYMRIWKNEVRMLKNLQNCKVVNPSLGVSTKGVLYRMITSYYKEDLLSYITNNPNISKQLCQKILCLFLKAIACLHENDIIHKDIKPENVLIEITSGRVTLKLIDFGFACYQHEANRLKRFQGTYEYLAPESLTHGIFSKNSDLFSAGMTAACVLYRKRLPWMEDLKRQNITLALDKIYTFSQKCPVQKRSIGYIIWKMMDFVPELRTSAAKAHEAIACKKFKSYYGKKVKFSGFVIRKAESVA